MALARALQTKAEQNTRHNNAPLITAKDLEQIATSKSKWLQWAAIGAIMPIHATTGTEARERSLGSTATCR